jgi:hypothetical protein
MISNHLHARWAQQALTTFPSLHHRNHLKTQLEGVSAQSAALYRISLRGVDSVEQVDSQEGSQEGSVAEGYREALLAARSSGEEYRASSQGSPHNQSCRSV